MALSKRQFNGGDSRRFVGVNYVFRETVSGVKAVDQDVGL